MSTRSRSIDPGAINPIDRSAQIVTVAIDNDFPIVIAGLGALLADYPDQVRVVSLYDESVTPDLVLFDTFGNDSSLEQYVQSSAAVKVVVFTAVDDPAAVIEALRVGVAGYIFKGVAGDDLVKTLLSVRDATQPIIAARTSKNSPNRAWPGRPHDLTEREAEVVALICQGLSNSDIGANLFLSINSVKTYIRGAYRKIGVDSRSKAVLWGVGHGFTLLPASEERGRPSSTQTSTGSVPKPAPPRSKAVNSAEG